VKRGRGPRNDRSAHCAPVDREPSIPAGTQHRRAGAHADAAPHPAGVAAQRERLLYCSLRVGTSILTAAALSFIGLGAPPPSPEWGAMLAEGRSYLGVADQITLFPGLAIFITVLAFTCWAMGCATRWIRSCDNMWLCFLRHGRQGSALTNAEQHQSRIPR
jgi:hypothetical protein